MAKQSLSKSTFIRGQQCLKSLYLYKNRYFLKDPVPPEQMAKFARGWSVNEFAHALHPGGIDVSPPSQKAVIRTSELINSGRQVIYEAAFMFDDVLIAIDMLVMTANGWKAVEVKSSMALSDTYYKDAFLQYYVITGSGLQLSDFELVHINPGYIRQGEIDANQLFTAVSVQALAEQNLQWVHDQLIIERQAVSAPKSPAIDIGQHCNNPYPCDFRGLCWKKIPQNSVFSMGGFSDEEKFDFYQKGFLIPEDIPDSQPLTALQQRIRDAHINHQPVVEKDQIIQLLSGFEHPLQVVSLLVCRPALPLYDNTSPYEVLEYACSILETDASGNMTGVKALVAEPLSNPKHQILKFLKENLDRNKSIISWDIKNLFSNDNFINKISAFSIVDLFDNYLYYKPDIYKSNNYYDIILKLKIKDNMEKPVYFSDIIAGATYVKIAESALFSDEKINDAEIEKLSAYCNRKAEITCQIFDFLKQL